MDSNTNTTKPRATTIGLLLSKHIEPRFKSNRYKGTICSQRTAGYEVCTAGESICVTFHTRTMSWNTQRESECNDITRERIATLLTERGYTVERITEQKWEPNGISTFGYYYPGDLRITKAAQ